MCLRQVSVRKGYDGAWVLNVPPVRVRRTGASARIAIGRASVWRTNAVAPAVPMSMSRSRGA